MFSPAPFESDEDALNELHNCDYTNHISLEDAKTGNVTRKVRVFSDGIFDLFHQGHARQLMQAKNAFPKCEVYLLVGVSGDKLTHAKKGSTVMSEKERYESVRHCRYVDQVIRDSPWEVSVEFMEKHKIDFIAHDDLPYTLGSGTDVYKRVKDAGMFVATQRTEGVSTSDVVARIVKNYDTFITRNLLRGYSRQELNVSFLRSQRILLQCKLGKVRKQTSDFKTKCISKFDETRKHLISSFVKMFGGIEFVERVEHHGDVEATTKSPENGCGKRKKIKDIDNTKCSVSMNRSYTEEETRNGEISHGDTPTTKSKRPKILP